MTYKHLFFDLDKTLWDFEKNARESLSILFDNFGLKDYYTDFEEFFISFNEHNDRLWDGYRNGTVKKDVVKNERFLLTLTEKGLSDPKLSVEIGNFYLNTTPTLTNLTPNAIEILDYLKLEKYEIHILTNGFLETQKRKMAHSKIDKYVSKLFSSDEFGINKPHKEIFHWAVSSVHAHKNECLMIGDDFEVDIIGAMNYGIDGAWYNPKKLSTDKQPTYNITDLLELKLIL